jgi:hypothetical protein
MSKRFPVPSFAYERFKNMDWARPPILSAQEQTSLAHKHGANGAENGGAYHVDASEAFYDRYRLRGEQRHVVMCVLPKRDVLLVGRSHAWAIQQALIVDSLDPDKSQVLYQWKTPRPMNTRLGPDNGVTFAGQTVYVVCAHRYADYWIVNRTAVDPQPMDDRTGFTIISATDDDINDFHACNLSFSWG